MLLSLLFVVSLFKGIHSQYLGTNPTTVTHLIILKAVLDVIKFISETLYIYICRANVSISGELTF